MQLVAERLVAPPASKAVYEYLDEKLPSDVPAVGRIPNPRPRKFVRVRTGGGSDVDLVAVRPTVFVECYADKVEDAEALSLECDSWLAQASLEGWLLEIPVRKIETISRPQELPDPLTDQARFTATYAPILRRAAVTVP